jgi:glyoxylase I family protein
MKIFHTALSVKSIAESQKFFEDVFALRFKVQGERPELGVKFVMLEDENGAIIELFEHNSPIPLKGDLMDFQQIGIKHIAFAVDDIDTVMQKALAHGATVIWPIKKGITIKRLAFIADPNGIPIELAEI